jgi:thymidylate synthase ThyX
MKMVQAGVPPQLAREILPIGIRAEINIKTNLVHWRHIFGQRCAPAAHPRMRELMIPLLIEVAGRIPYVFDENVKAVLPQMTPAQLRAVRWLEEGRNEEA